MSATPPATAPQGNNKPSLTGARIKQRKGVVKSQAKFEPEAFRDALYKHLESVPTSDFEGYATALDKAGNSLDYRKYGDQLFEILIVGGLLAPGGTFIDDEAPPSPFAIFNASSSEVKDIKPFVGTIDKLIRRYKFLQKPLEESTLPGILQYINRFEEGGRDKLATLTALMIQMGLAGAGVLITLQKEHLLKDDLSLNFVTKVFRAYLVDSSMETLGTSLRKGGVRDLLLFFPSTRRDQPQVISNHFRSESVNLPVISDWWSKRALKEARDSIALQLAEKRQTAVSEAFELEQEAEEAKLAGGEIGEKTFKEKMELVKNNLVKSNSEIVSWLNSEKVKNGLKEEELVPIIWEGLMKSVDWPSARPDQMDSLALREVNKVAPILEKLITGAKSEMTLINTIQLYCYEDTKIIKTFPGILKVLYNRDVISDQAILYWAQKGARPQGKGHFLKATESLVKFLQEQSDDEDEDDE